MISVRGLNYSYNKACHVLEQISFDAEEGQCIAVLGNNGAGKSTMIKCMNRILQPQEGAVVICGRDVQKLKRQTIAQDMAYVAQQNESGQFTVYDAILLGRKPYIKLNPTEEDHKIVRNVIGRMGLEPFTLRYLDELSGGELQKVMLARALAQQPKVLMLDEPTSNLDLRNQYEVLRIIREIAIEDKICVVIVIHDLNLALRYCDQFLFIKDCSVYSIGGVDTVSRDTINEVYGMNVAIENIHGYPTVVPLCS